MTEKVCKNCKSYKDIKRWMANMPNCVRFEEKTHGPFFAHRLGSRWVITAPSLLPSGAATSMPSPSTVAVWHSKKIAQRICDWLNERWAERDDDD